MIFWHPCDPCRSRQWKTVRLSSQMISSHLMDGCWRDVSTIFPLLLSFLFFSCLCTLHTHVNFSSSSSLPFNLVKFNAGSELHDWNWCHVPWSTKTRRLVEWQRCYKQLSPLGGALTGMGKIKDPSFTHETRNPPENSLHGMHIYIFIYIYLFIFERLGIRVFYFIPHCSPAVKTWTSSSMGHRLSVNPLHFHSILSFPLLWGRLVLIMMRDGLGLVIICPVCCICLRTATQRKLGPGVVSSCQQTVLYLLRRLTTSTCARCPRVNRRGFWRCTAQSRGA